MDYAMKQTDFGTYRLDFMIIRSEIIEKLLESQDLKFNFCAHFLFFVVDSVDTIGHIFE